MTDYTSLLAQFGPTEEDKAKARQNALLRTGLGILAASGPSRLPQNLGGILAQGGMAGMDAYQQDLSRAANERKSNVLMAAQLGKLNREAEEAKRNRDIQDWVLRQLGFGPQSGAVPAHQVGLSPSSSAAFSGINPNAVLMTLAGQPQLGKMIHDTTKPTDRQREAIALGFVPGTPAYNNYVGTQFNQGGAWQVGPDGRLQLAPGYAQGMGEVKGAEEAARAAYDLVPVPMPGGGTQLLPRSVAATRLGGGAQAAPAVPAVPPANGNTQSSPSGQAPGSGFGYSRPAAQTGAESRFAETLASEFAKNYADLQRADFNAPASISKYQQLGSLLSRVKTGKFTATTTQIKAAAKSAGIDLGALGIADDVAPAQAALALSNQLALELRNPAGGAGMPGALSDKDREFLVSMVPGLENDPGAIPVMIEYRVKLAQRERDVAKMARAYKKKHGRFDDGFYEELAAWSERNPLFTEADRRKAPGGGFRVLGVEGQ